jgi:hypothetical protein
MSKFKVVTGERREFRDVAGELRQSFRAAKYLASPLATCQHGARPEQLSTAGIDFGGDEIVAARPLNTAFTSNCFGHNDFFSKRGLGTFLVSLATSVRRQQADQCSRY